MENGIRLGCFMIAKFLLIFNRFDNISIVVQPLAMSWLYCLFSYT